MRKLFSLFMALLATTTLWAYDFQSGDLYYNITSETTVEVTYQHQQYPSSNYVSLTSIAIPSTVTYNATTYSVTSIGNRAFIYCDKLTSVTIPNSVTSIGDFAFHACSSLTSITIPYSVTSIGDCAFLGCRSLTSITIPNSVTSIGEEAFSSCSSLTSIVVESGNTIYDSRDNCNAIIEIATNTLIAGCQNTVIPNTITSIGSRAFSYCSSLTSITIPNSVTSIGHRTFEDCSSLTSITIPNSVTSIGVEAFYDCSSLTSVTIGNSVTSIGNWAFDDCSSLISITCLGTTPPTLGTNVFNGTKLSAVYIPDNTLSAYQTAWGNEYAFVNNENTPTLHVATPGTLEDLIFEAGTRPVLVDKLILTGTLNDADFTCMRETMTSLAYVDLSGITNTNGVNFNAKSKLVKIILPANLTSIGERAFESCSSLISINIPNSVTSIGEEAFSGCSSLTSVTIGNSVTSIGNRAFYNCSSLTSVTIPNSVTSIGNWAFYDCSSLTSVTIPNSVTSIGDFAFRGCSSLTSVTIPNSVTTVGGGMFCMCSKLKSVVLSNNIISLPCYSEIQSYGYDEWYDIYGFFENCSSLTSITIPNSVTSIGSSAFRACSSLTSITIPNSVTSIGDLAFYGCSSLTSITIPNSVTTVGGGMFCGCHKLESVVLSNNMISLPCYSQKISNAYGTSYYIYGFFESCSSLTSVTIPNSVTSIGDYAFRGCRSLSSVAIGNGVTHIDEYAFYGCTGLNLLRLGTGIQSIAADAFSDCTKLYDIYCLAAEPPTGYKSSFANYNAFIHVPCESQRLYMLDVLFGEFKYIECISSDEVTTDDIVITPGLTDVTIIWPSEDYADTYTIIIKKGNEVFCTLTFNKDGHLLNIAFAPGRDGNHPAQYAEQAANGYRFTVTGLEEGTDYTYDITVKDASNKTIKSHSGKFTTESLTAVENTHIQSPMTDCQKIIHNGQLLILRDGKIYTVMGQEL